MMFTSIRAKMFVKDEYQPLIDRLMNNSEIMQWSQLHSTLPFVQQYAKVPRSGHIPFGALTYAPSEWGVYDKTHGFNVHVMYEPSFERLTGLWTFQCSLRDKANTIDQFMDLIVNNIVDQIIHLETKYEGDNYSNIYNFVNNSVRITHHKAIDQL
ncbi:hypothetical protein [Virgibacillus salexigens]|uniref:Uncharacterized protein n=1 Tax=Virgibacillus massiliensis TaxID=1462526 RepID=A0A024QIS7_9BACI|nr:hypothetical protein [Virgibacillus massiliensis]CDQ41861.1 hypothetical protein BN990_04240 [Virgibacillus massiliensis]